MVIEDIVGHGVSGDSHASLQFHENGRVSGSGRFHRLIGSSGARGGALLIEPTGTTMMPCLPVSMDQERKRLDLLSHICGWQMRADFGNHRECIRARR